MKLLALLLCSLPAFAAGPVLASALGGNYTSGAVLTVTVTATGTNLFAVVWAMDIVGGTGSPPTVNGQAMTLVSTHAFTNYVETVHTYIYSGPGLMAGPVSAVSTCSGYCEVDVLVFSGGNQTSTADALATWISGNTAIASPPCTSGGYAFTLPITTVANNALMIGFFNPAITLASSPSNNATYIGADPLGNVFWYSTPNVSPAGSFSMQACSSVGAPANVQANGLSIAPYAAPATFISNPTIVTVGP